MKYLYLISCLGLLACGTTTTPPAMAPVTPSPTECNQLYLHVLQIQLDTQVDPNHSMTVEQRQQAIHSLDQDQWDTGTTYAFFQFCAYHMTVDQVRCACQADTLAGINVCKLSPH